MMNEDDVHWIEQAIQMAEQNVSVGEDPFAAIVVRGGEIVGKGVNSVYADHDPSAHAELIAVRDACKRLKTIDLSDCILYASAEPCPMCMGSIYWANLGSVYYACSKEEATAEVGFGDPLEHFYSDMTGPLVERSISFYHIDSSRKFAPFIAKLGSRTNTRLQDQQR